MRTIQPISHFDRVLDSDVSRKEASDFSGSHESFEGVSSSSLMAYNEMADVPVHQVDPVAELQRNLAHLQELQSRMKFMMREVTYLLKV